MYDWPWLHLIDAYVLGDRLQSAVFVNAIIDKMISTIEYGIPSAQVFRYAFEKTTTKSPLRMLLLHCAYKEAWTRFLEANFCSAQHPDFVNGLGTLLARYDQRRTFDLLRQPGKPKWAYDQGRVVVCETYHVHKEANVPENAH